MGTPRVELGNYPRQRYSLPLAYAPDILKGNFKSLYIFLL